MTAVVDRGSLTTAAFTRLQTVTGATILLGEPTLPLPLVQGTDGRVAPYAILWPGGGTPSAELDLGDSTIDLDWLIQITCAAGNVDDVMALATDADDLFYRWAPVVSGLVCGPMRPPLGFDPGPVRYDRNVHPHRPFLPLQYVSRITT